MCHNKISEVAEQTTNTISDTRFDILKNVFTSHLLRMYRICGLILMKAMESGTFWLKRTINQIHAHTCPTAVCSLLLICTHLLAKSTTCKKQSNELTTVLLIAHKLINTKRTQTRRGNIQRLNRAITTDEIKYSTRQEHPASPAGKQLRLY